MPEKNMLQGYKTSNRTRTGPRIDGNGYTILKKGSVLFPYSGKKGECGILSCKNNDRYQYDKRNTDTAKNLTYQNLKKSDREKSMLLDELFALRKADKEREAKFLEKLDRMTEQLMNLNESSQEQVKVLDGLKQMIASRDILIKKLQKENASLKE